MNSLIISNIVLWLAVVGLSLVVFALTRQIGVLYERVAPAGALAMSQKLKVGDLAPTMDLMTVTNHPITIAPKNPTKSQLLFFVAPGCPICKSLFPILKSSYRVEKDWLDIVLASDGDDQKQLAMIEQYKLQQLPFVLSKELGQQYAVAKLPFAVLIDQQGKIASLGLVNSREHLESLFEAKERGVASLQDYLAQKA
ncbi:MAG: redoxin family protein [Gammaproteobacteria bacterium]|nr:redoxin family protein [Gammaproteobacteria bacterium]